MLALHQLVGLITDWWDAYVEAHEEPMLVFSAPAILKVYRIIRFQFRVGIVNTDIKDSSWLRPLLLR
jgi:hypothetical protein